MSAAATVNDVIQERRLVTEIPGPASQGWLARKNAAVAAGVVALSGLAVRSAIGQGAL